MELVLKDIVRGVCVENRIADARGEERDVADFYAAYPVARKLDGVIRKGLRFECGRFRIEGVKTAEPVVGEYGFWAKDIVAQIRSPRELAGLSFSLHQPHALPATYWQDDLCRRLREGFLKLIPAHLLREE